MKNYLLLLALLPLFAQAQSTQRIEADNILLQTRTPQISNANVTVNGTMKITSVANGGNTDSLLVIANGTLKRVSRSSFATDYVSKTIRDTTTAIKVFTSPIYTDSIYTGMILPRYAYVLIYKPFMQDPEVNQGSRLRFTTNTQNYADLRNNPADYSPSPDRRRSFYLPNSIASDTLATKTDLANYVPQSRTINGVDLSANRTFTTNNISEGDNLYYTNARARQAISLTTTGTGAATYNNSTGVLNVPTNSSGGVTVGTYAQRIAISPTAGQQFYQNNENDGLYVGNGATWEKMGSSLLFQEEFLANYSNQTSISLPYLIGNVSGTSANFSTPSGVSNSYSYGLLQMNTGTTTTGLSRIYYNFTGVSNLHFANTVTYTEYLVYIPTLSDATETYVLKVGDESNVTQTVSNNNTQFRYTHGENSGAWSVQYRTNSGTGTNVTTGVTVAAATWYRLGIKRIFPNDMVSGTLTVEFYINGTLTNSVAASPVWYIGVPAFVGIYKSAGTTSRSVVVDYIKHYKLK